MDLDDALPKGANPVLRITVKQHISNVEPSLDPRTDRKSTRLNSSHGYISYAVFCLKKQKQQTKPKAIFNYPVTLLLPEDDAASIEVRTSMATPLTDGTLFDARLYRICTYVGSSGPN